jgi:hypothetical protein
MEHDVIDDLEQRLRAARPQAARADGDAFNAELLARLREQPIDTRRTVPRVVAVPVVAGVTLTAAAVVMLGGGPGEVGGPSSAAAITQTLRWMTPPSGTVLHVRSVETQDGLATTHESWQSADHPGTQRVRTVGAKTYETSNDGLYDPATNTIYDTPTDKPPKPLPGKDGIPVADPVVAKVRYLLEAGHMTVTGREVHNGVDTWAVSLKPDAGRPVWTLWVAADDGKPLELRDPGRDASEKPQVIRWPTYEVLTDASADRLLTLKGAHPSAAVVHDPAQAAAAEQRLMAGKP